MVQSSYSDSSYKDMFNAHKESDQESKDLFKNPSSQLDLHQEIMEEEKKAGELEIQSHI